MTTAAMNNLWNYIQGLNLSQRNRTWLAERLQEPKCKSVQPKSYSLQEMQEILPHRMEQYEKGEYEDYQTVSEEMQTWV